jgi:hypothetical protein
MSSLQFEKETKERLLSENHSLEVSRPLSLISFCFSDRISLLCLVSAALVTLSKLSRRPLEMFSKKYTRSSPPSSPPFFALCSASPLPLSLCLSLSLEGGSVEIESQIHKLLTEHSYEDILSSFEEDLSLFQNKNHSLKQRNMQLEEQRGTLCLCLWKNQFQHNQRQHWAMATGLPPKGLPRKSVGHLMREWSEVQCRVTSAKNNVDCHHSTHVAR